MAELSFLSNVICLSTRWNPPCIRTNGWSCHCYWNISSDSCRALLKLIMGDRVLGCTVLPDPLLIFRSRSAPILGSTCASLSGYAFLCAPCLISKINKDDHWSLKYKKIHFFLFNNCLERLLTTVRALWLCYDPSTVSASKQQCCFLRQTRPTSRWWAGYDINLSRFKCTTATSLR